MPKGRVKGSLCPAESSLSSAFQSRQQRGLGCAGPGGSVYHSLVTHPKRGGPAGNLSRNWCRPVTDGSGRETPSAVCPGRLRTWETKYNDRDCLTSS